MSSESNKPRDHGIRLVSGDVVHLRRPIPADEDEFLLLRKNSGRHLTRWEPERGGTGRSMNDFELFMQNSRTPSNEKVLICRNEDGIIVGAVGFNQIIRGVAQFCSLGYWIGKEHSGRGYMTEAMMLALEHAFGQLALHRVEVNVQPNNSASLKIVQKCGFRREGYSPGFLKIAGKWADHERWAMLVDQWRPVSKQDD